MSYNSFYLWRNTAQNLEYCIDDIQNQTFDFNGEDNGEIEAYIKMLELLQTTKEIDFDLLLKEAKSHL